MFISKKILKALSVVITVCFCNAFIFTDFARALSDPAKSVSFNIDFLDGIHPDFYVGSDGKNSKVFIVQDLHGDKHVQKNISDIIEYLSENNNINEILLEGAAGRINYNWLTGLNDKHKNAVLNDLLSASLLSGAEYYALSNAKENKLKGLENEYLHSSNIKRLQDIQNIQPQIKQELSLMKSAINARQKKVYSSENKKLLNFEEKYLNGKRGAKDFYGYIIARASKINDEKIAEDLKVLNKALKTFEIPAKLQTDLVNKEIESLIKKLKNELPYKAYVKITDKTKNFSDEHITYTVLNEILKENYINEYNNLRRYLSYYTEQRNIDKTELIKAEEYIIKELYNYNSSGNSERALVAFSRAFKHFEKYFLAEATNFDYDYINQFGVDAFIGLYSEKFNTNIAAIKSNKDIYEKYHTVNIIRNIFFAEKIEESLNNHNGKVVAVMGGFHSDGVGKILKSKNITYEVVTPSLFQTSSNAKDVYLKHLKNSVDSQTLALRIYLERNDTEQMKELFQVKYAELLASHGLNRALSELNSWLNIISNVTEDDIAEATGNRPENFAKIQDTSVSLNSDGSVKIEFTSILNGKQEKVNFNINDGTPRGGYASLAGWATQKITKFAAFWEWIYMLPFSSFAFGSKTLNKVLSSKLDSDITVEKSSAFDKILDITSVFFLFGIFIFSPPMAVAAYVLMRAALFSSLHKVYYGDIKQHVKLFFLGIVFAVPLIGNGAHYAYNESARQPASIITPSAMSRGSFSVDILIELIDKFQNESPKEVRESDVLNDEFSTIVLETVKHAIPKIKTEDDLMLAFEMLAFLVQSKTWLSASTDSLSTIGPYQLKDRNTSSYERSWLNTEDAETAIAEKLNFLIEDESSKQFGNKNKKSNIYLFKNIEALYFLYFARKKEKLKIYIPEGKDIGYISGYQNSNNRNSVVERTDLLNADKIFFKTDGIDDVFREMDFVLEQYNANNMSLEGKEVFFELNSIERLTDGQRDKLQRYFESQGIKIYLLFPVVSAFSPGSFLKQMLPSQPFVVLSNYSMPNELDKEKVFLERNAGGRVSNYVRNIIFMLLNAEQSGSYLQNEKYYTPGTEILKEGYETFRRLLSFRARKAFDIMSGKENLFTNEGEQVINEDEQNLNIKIKNLFNKALDKLLKSDSSRPELILDVMKMIRNLFVFNALRASNFHNALDTSEKLKTVEKAYMDLALTDIYEYSSEVNIDTKGNEVSSMLCTSGMGVFITLVEYILRTGGLDSSNIILNTSSSYYEYMPYLNNIGLGNWEGAADIIRGYDGDGKKLDDVEIDYGKTNLVLLEPVYNRYDMNVDDIEGFFRKVLIDPSSGERRVFDKPFYVCIDRTAVPLWNIFDIIDELPDNFHVVVYNSLQKLHENSWELATGGGALLISGNNLELHKKFADGMDVTRQACGQVPDVYAVNAFERLFSLGKRMLLQRIKRITSNTETVAKAMAEAAAINPYINKIVSHVSINGQADDMPNLAMPFIAIDPKNKYSFSNPNQKPAAAENDAIADLLALLRAAGIYDAVDRNSYGFDSLTLARYDKGIRVATGDYPAFIANQVASILSGYTSQVLALSKFSDNEDNMDAGAAAEQITQILAGGQYMDTIMFKNHVLKLLNISHQKVKDGDEKYHKLFIVASIAVSMISFDEKRDENYYNKNKPSYKKEIKNIMENTNDDVFEFFMKNLRIAKEIHPYKTRSFMKDFGIDTLLIDKILKNYVAEENAQSLATLRNIIVKILEELNIDITESDKVRIIAERIIKELEIDPALNIMRDIRTAISEKFGIDISKNRDMDKANIGRILQEFNVNIKRLIAANDIRTTDASTDLMFITKDSQGNETEDGRIINTRFFSEMLRAA